MDRDIKPIKLFDLFDLVISAEDYGFNNSVLMSSLYAWAAPVTDAEIEAFADSFTSPACIAQGYGEEDGDAARVSLLAWRKRYAR